MLVCLCAISLETKTDDSVGDQQQQPPATATISVRYGKLRRRNMKSSYAGTYHHYGLVGERNSVDKLESNIQFVRLQKARNSISIATQYTNNIVAVILLGDLSMRMVQCACMSIDNNKKHIP